MSTVQTNHAHTANGDTTGTTPTNGKARTFHVSSTISKVLLIIALVMQAVVILAFLLMSLIWSPVFERLDTTDGTPRLFTEHVLYERGYTSVAPFLIAIAAVILFFMLAALLERVHRVKMRNVALTFITVVQIFWIAALNMTAYTYPDPSSLGGAAIEFNAGNLDYFTPDYCADNPIHNCNIHGILGFEYFNYYPFQAGPLLWFMMIYKLFGPYNIIAFQLVNAFIVTGLAATLWHFGKTLGLNRFGQNAVALLMMTCVPLLMFATFVYPNAVGFTFTLAGVALALQGIKAKRAWTSCLLLVGGFILCGLGILLKSTFVIVLMAAVIAVVVTVLFSHRFWQLIPSAVGAVLAMVISKLPAKWLAHVTGQHFMDMPMMSWIRLGLTRADEGSTPGWFSLRVFEPVTAAHGDYDTHAMILSEEVKQRIAFFIHDPGYAFTFFRMKLLSEWAEPSFMTSLYSRAGDSGSQYRGIAGVFLEGAGEKPLAHFEDAMQSITYLFAFIGVIGFIVATARLRSTTAHGHAQHVMLFSRTFFSAAFLGGVICFTFWEAKSIYTLPFFLMLLPVAAYGMQMTYAWGASQLRKRRGPAPAKHGDPDEPGLRESGARDGSDGANSLDDFEEVDVSVISSAPGDGTDTATR